MLAGRGTEARLAGDAGVNAGADRAGRGAPGAGDAAGVNPSVRPPAVTWGAVGAGVWPGGEPFRSAAIVGPNVMRSVKSNKKLETPSHRTSCSLGLTKFNR